MDAQSRLAELGIELPPAPKAIGLYRPLVIVGRTAMTSGHLPVQSDGSLIMGRLGENLDVDAGFAAARQTGLAILATLQETLGSLDRVGRVVKILGMVNCTTDFIDQPKVINGCSELFRDVFGEESGVGARGAVGVGSLPSGVATEIEAVFELAEDA